MKHILLPILCIMTLSLFGENTIALCIGSDTTYYEDFPEAIKEVNKAPSASIQLLGDVRFNGQAASQTIRKNLTIDLNGYSLGDTLTGTSLLYLNIDTVTLTITSSRPGGRLWAVRDHNGRITALSVNRGTLDIRHTTVEAKNIGVYDAETNKNVSAACVSIGSYATLQMDDCRLKCEGYKATGLSCSGGVGAAADITVRNCSINALGGTAVYGISCYNTSTLENNTITAVSDGPSAYGINLNKYTDTTQTADIEAAIHHMNVKVQAQKSAYGIYSRAPISLTHDTVEVHADSTTATGVYATHNLTAQHCTLTAVSDSTYATGLSISAVSVADISDCTVQVSAAKGSAYGLSGSGNKESAAAITLQHVSVSARGKKNVFGFNCYSTVQMEHCQAEVYASESYAYGMNIYNYVDTTRQMEIEATLRDIQLRANAFKVAYGLFARAGVHASECVMNAQTDSTQAYSCYLNYGQADIQQCELNAASGLAKAYAVYPSNGCSYADFQDCKFKTDATTESAITWNNRNMEGKLFFHGGFYSNPTNLRSFLPEGHSIYRLWDSQAEYVKGYRYTIQPIDDPDAIVACVYDNSDNSIPARRFYYLTDALKYVNNNTDKSLTIVIVGSCVLPKGNYILPKNTTLLVPYDENQRKAFGTSPLRTTEYMKREELVRLVLADSAYLQVNGMLEISALQCANGESFGGPRSSYGLLVLSPQARITVMDQAFMQAWGYVIGKGVIEVQAGARIAEFLQFGDWKGARVTYSILNNKERVFPVTHYFYQNIESPVIYHAGAKAVAATAVYMSEMLMTYNDVKLISDEGALFVFQDNTSSDATIRKEYDPATDRVIWTTNGQVALNELSITFDAGFIGSFGFNSSQYVLPLSTNMTLVSERGNLTINHDAVMLPGAEVYIAQEASVTIPQKVNLYLYDIAQYGAYNDHPFYSVAWTPSWTMCPRDSILTSAKMEVSGTVYVRGALYATAGGANIIGSDKGEGIVDFIVENRSSDAVYQLVGNYDSYSFAKSPVTCAPLRNADGTKVQTGSKGPYRYQAGKWLRPNNEQEGLRPLNAHAAVRKRIDAYGCHIILPNGEKYNLLGVKE